MELNLPEKKEENFWILNEDGSALPASSLETDAYEEDDLDEWHEKLYSKKADPKSRPVYKTGGPNRTKR